MKDGGTGAFICVGIVLGIVFGAVFGNVGLGLVFGIFAGLAIAMFRNNKKKDQ